MSRKQKKQLMRIGLSIALLIVAALLPLDGWAKLIVFIIPYLFIGWDILLRSARNIARGQVFDENFLMSIATLGAFVIGEYAEGSFVMIFYQLGEWFEHYAVGKSRQSIAKLMDIRPDRANLVKNGEIHQVDPEEVVVGDTIRVQPGERIPLDGIVLDGFSSLDTAALTGEATPREVQPGDPVISGCVSLTGVLTLRVTKTYGESTVARILELVENAASSKARTESFITRFARYYTPFVVIAAVLLAVIPSLMDGQWGQWFERALIFLVVSCPCALVISVPLSYFGGIGGASRHGILVKGANYLEALAKVDTVVMDKTGTLTTGDFQVVSVYPTQLNAEDLLEIAALAESASSHPIATSICKAWKQPLNLNRVEHVKEHAGYGVSARVDGKQVEIGSLKHLEKLGINCQHPAGVTAIHMAVEGLYAGYLTLGDTLKPQAAETVRSLKQQGIQRTVLLTGDSQLAGTEIAQTLGMDAWHCELLPQDKVAHVEKLLHAQASGRKLAFVGDGINDAPVLSRADVGIAMGAMGSDAAIEAADVVLMDDRPDRLALAIRIARKTQRIVVENIIFALGVKALVMLLGAAGLAGMWAASFADVGVAVIAILNAMRAMRIDE